MAELELQRKPWKVWMSSAPQPTAVLTTAYDLLQSEGTKLGHNLVILNENVYAASVFNGSFEQFYRYALDISPATFDKRAKTRVENIDLTEDLGITASFATGSDSVIDFYVQDKDAALYPTDLKTSFAVNSTWKRYFHNASILAQNDVTTSYQISEMFTASVDTNSSSTSDIYVRDTDEVFTATMVFEDGKKAYTKVGVNRTEKILKLVLGALFFNSNNNNDAKLDQLGIYLSSLNSSQREKLFSKLINAQLNGKPLLSYIYLWVKAPFCADYIDPADFNQDLNQDADVVHQNLLLANDYTSVRNNFNRYNEDVNYGGTTSSDMVEKMSRPYCPMTSPMKDLLSEKLLQLSGISTDKSVRDIAKDLLEDSLQDESYIGSVLVVPKGTSTTDNSRFTPFTYYDPESREEEDYYYELGKVPTLVGRAGNLTTDGRIMSPTIDELWYIIYKAILGNANDTSDVLSLPSGSNYGKNKDTSLFEATKEYKWTDDKNGNVKGNPLNFTFSTNDDGEVNGISVNEWVANPEEHYINIHTQIKNVSAKINKFFNEQNEDVAGSRDIFHTGGDIAFNDESVHTKDEITLTGREYGPRNVPLSLRELEAALMGIKYNVDNNFIFDSKTYAVSGKFGKIEKDENDIIVAGGSLYQMHRDYNADVENPNTMFKMGASNKEGTFGRDATFGDLNNEKEYHKDKTPVYLLDKNNKRTSVEKTSGMPLLVENYGKSVSLAAEQGEYTGSDVYMAADGTWRYKAEHMRLPILRSRY